MKQVKKDKLKQVKKNFKLDIVNLIKNNLNPSKIAIHLNISLPRLSYYLSSLKREGIIRKKGYGVWEVIPSGEVKMLSHKGSFQLKNIRGHAFIWKIKPNKSFNWLKLIKDLNYELKGLSKTPRVVINQRKVWLGNKYITIFETSLNSFYGANAIESKKNAIYEMIKIIEELKRTLKIDFKYQFTCKRQHYGLIDSTEAKQFIKEGKRILIKNEKGYWFSIDFSENKYQEAETINERDADIDSLGYQRLMNSHEKTKFKVTPEFILTTMNGIQKNQLIFDKNMKSHLEILKKLGLAIDRLTKAIKTKQTKIGDFL